MMRNLSGKSHRSSGVGVIWAAMFASPGMGAERGGGVAPDFPDCGRA